MTYIEYEDDNGNLIIDFEDEEGNIKPWKILKPYREEGQTKYKENMDVVGFIDN